ncbi:MAG: Lpp/OprI family alanine-zipper lipoprotein [Desulfobacterales bacterium]|nr:Lpp/OprI family alanine-zipper lipoprotein [Desulfobacterales bacterium]
MKKILFLFSMVLVIGTLVTGCATTGELEKVQAQQKMSDAKADQALKDSQAAKSAADAAKVKADETSARADSALKAAEEREKIAAEKEKIAVEKELIAAEKAKKAEAAFEKSMKK